MEWRAEQVLMHVCRSQRLAANVERLNVVHNARRDVVPQPGDVVVLIATRRIGEIAGDETDPPKRRRERRAVGIAGERLTLEAHIFRPSSNRKARLSIACSTGSKAAKVFSNLSGLIKEDTDYRIEDKVLLNLVRKGPAGERHAPWERHPGHASRGAADGSRTPW